MQSTTSSTRTFITPAGNPDKQSDKRQSDFKPRKLLNRKNLPWLVVSLLVLVIAFLFLQYRSAQHKLQANNTQQVKSLIAKVRKLVVVPADEIPTVATVVHADKLKSQTFFQNANDGDKVLVYSREKEAILYRPSSNQIVTIAPVNVTPTSDNTNLSK